MRPQGKTSSAENSTMSESTRTRRRLMGMWLSLGSQGSLGCPHCNKSVKSKQAMGGRQNAHHSQRIQMQTHMEIMEEEKRREVREGKRINSCCCNISAPLANDGAEIDLELRLSSSPPKMVKEFYEFLSLERVKEYDAGAHAGSGVNKIYADQTHPRLSPAASSKPLMFLERAEMPLKTGADEGGVGCGLFLKASGASDAPGANPHVRFLSGGRGTPKVSSKTGLDLTLKL